MEAFKRAWKTFGKYLLWTMVAAGLTYATDNLTAMELPTWVTPVIAAALKSAATYVATQKG